MKVSRYNFIHTKKDITVFYNSKTGALATVDSDFVKVINAIKEGNFTENEYSPILISQMKYAGAIIDDEIDELKEVEFISNSQKYDSSILYLTIAPTLNCNCRCKYCYEKRERNELSLELQEAILRFIQQYTKIKTLELVWYGGEPLLTKSIVWSMSEKIMEYCLNNNISYSASMISNLTLMSEDDCALFKKFSINKFQATLDGSREVHNRTRIEPNSTDSYGKILKNINLLLRNNISVDLRVNLDKNNIADLDSLFEDLRIHLLNSQYLHIYPGRIANYSKVCNSIESSCLSDNEWDCAELQFFEKCIKYGFKEAIKPFIIDKTRFLSCGADQKNFVIVDSKGYLYKCMLHVGNVDKAYGKVTDDVMDTTKSIEWLMESPFSFNKCKSCDKLPICMGGCKEILFNTKQPACPCRGEYFLEKIDFYMLNYAE